MNRLLILLSVWGALAPTIHAQVKSVRIPLDGYAATVNTNIITIGDVYEAIHEASQRLRALHSGKELEEKSVELFMSGLERLIDQHLIIEEYYAQKLQLPERLVDDEINEIITKRYEGDRAAMLATLAENQVTLEEWRSAIRDQIIVRMMRSKEIGERIVISPRQIKEAYEARQDKYNEPARVRLRMIYKSAGTKADEVRTQMLELRKKIESGQSFESLAKENSEDPSAMAGGDWGWIEPNQLRAELSLAIQNAAAGTVTDVIEIPDGFYILKVEEQKEAEARTFDEVRGDIEKELRESQGEKFYREWIKRLRDKYPVVYHIPTLPDSQP